LDELLNAPPNFKTNEENHPSRCLLRHSLLFLKRIYGLTEERALKRILKDGFSRNQDENV